MYPEGHFGFRPETFLETFPFMQTIVFFEMALVETDVLDGVGVGKTIGVGVAVGAGETTGVGVAVGVGSGVPPVIVTNTGEDANPLATTRREDKPLVIVEGNW